MGKYDEIFYRICDDMILNIKKWNEFILREISKCVSCDWKKERIVLLIPFKEELSLL